MHVCVREHVCMCVCLSCTFPAVWCSLCHKPFAPSHSYCTAGGWSHLLASVFGARVWVCVGVVVGGGGG